MVNDMNSEPTARFTTEGTEKLLKDMARKILDLQAELDKHRWIPVAERLPEDNQCVFVAMKHIKTTWGFLAWYSPVTTKKWEFYDPMVKGEVTHWKPIILPKAKL